ncbi:hypothetical protein HUT18_22425 [Streptomyces sp. NA04227]|uniref:hypothetical protein n=1 Tax=Streptomyces sp. NA04227 TaxID=2742136 RepID=UPI001592AC8B|nr:hypothetical protein [Streptomyces sp. NA04227]QKW08719.1 hypothetical protein HUT18_22425 [Streptomyces sp. NA04227]
MPEPSEGAPVSAGQGGTAPDFFDRLLARHAPAATPAPRDVARVRPRLAGPFERVEAVRGDGFEEPSPSEPGAGSPWPTTPQVPDPSGRLGPSAAQLHTEHERTVVRTEQSGEPGPGLVREVVRESSGEPLLRPSASVRPGVVPGSTAAGRRGPDARDGEPTAPTPASSTGVGERITAPALTPPAVRPSTGDAATVARGAARAASGRRAPRGGERTVHVQIGRLEVSAAGAADRRREEAREGAGRRPASLALDEFLRRDTEGRG